MRRVLALLAAVTLLFGCEAAEPPAKARDPAAPTYAVETLARGLANPWSLAFLPDGALLITEKYGGVRVFRDGLLGPRLAGGPAGALQDGDSGLLDVVLDPEFAANRRVFVAFTEGTEGANRLALYRATFDGQALRDGRVVFRAGPDKNGTGHSGGRIVFLPDKTLLLTNGEGFTYRDKAQDLASGLGKTFRLDRDGRPPPDNPFLARPGVRPEIFSYGHRNAMGLLRDPRSGVVWSHENGPRGGDEINVLKPGANYGWPLVTYGVDYSGELISAKQEAPGIEKPAMIWSPSIAPSGFALYLGDRFPKWRGDFHVGALADRSLRRVRMRNGEMALQEVLLGERKARIRDVRVGPDGLVYLLTDDRNGELLRLRPA